MSDVEYGSADRTSSRRRREPPRPHSADGPQHLLMTLLGDYWFGRDELLPSAALVELLSEFGTNEHAARQSMRRLAQRGLLAQGRQGRTTQYGIPAGIVADQRLRLARAVTFGSDFADWDGTWTLVAFSIPESERDVRRQLRNGLRRLGFGDLQDGTWISPHDRERGAVALLDALDVGQGHVMRATWAFRDGDREAMADAFELPALDAAYEAFIVEYAPYLAVGEDVDPSEALRLRTRITNDWLAFRLTDPELPAELLPPDWVRRRARELFLELYDRLGARAAAHVRAIIARHDEALSSIVTHHGVPTVDARLGRGLAELARAPR